MCKWSKVSKHHVQWIIHIVSVSNHTHIVITHFIQLYKNIFKCIFRFVKLKNDSNFSKYIVYSFIFTTNAIKDLTLYYLCLKFYCVFNERRGEIKMIDKIIIAFKYKCITKERLNEKCLISFVFKSQTIYLTKLYFNNSNFKKWFIYSVLSAVLLLSLEH